MKTVNFTPTPTEYKGVQFKSKCEAMFALYLDIEMSEMASIADSSLLFDQRRYGNKKQVSNNGFGWVYEPCNLNTGGWIPDFYTWQTFTPFSPSGEFPLHIHWRVIEYKPSVPTNTYMHNWLKRITLLNNKLVEKTLHWHSYCRFELYFGSIYTPTTGSFWIGANQLEEEDLYIEWFKEPYEGKNEWIDDNNRAVISEYRFDLADE